MPLRLSSPKKFSCFGTAAVAKTRKTKRARVGHTAKRSRGQIGKCKNKNATMRLQRGRASEARKGRLCPKLVLAPRAVIHMRVLASPLR